MYVCTISLLQDTSLYNEIGVMATSKNTPVFYFRSSGREESFALTIFDVFTAGPPDDSKFEAPPSCLVPSVQGQGHKGSSVHRTGKDIQQIRSSLFKKADALMRQV